MKKDNSKKLLTSSIPKLLISFSSSILFALILNCVYTLTDALFISHTVGDNAMGSVSVAFPFVILQGAISTAIGSGGASLVSRYLGKNDKKLAGNVAFNSMILFYITAIIITVFGLFTINPILSLLGVTDELFESAKNYFVIILICNVFSTGFSSIIRAEGKMGYGLLIWVIPISVNIILDAVFIIGLNMGVVGSALATVISQFLSFLMSVLFFTRFSTLEFSSKKPSVKTMMSVLTLGLPSLIQMGSLSLITAVINNALSKIGGTNSVNSFAYVNKITGFAIMPLTAFCQGLSPIVAYNYGANNIKRTKKALYLAFLFSLIYSLFAVIMLNLFDTQAVSIFTSNIDMIKESSLGVKILSYSLIFVPFTMLFGSYYQSIGKRFYAFIFYLSSPLIFLILVILFSKNSSVNDLLWLYVISNVVSAIFSLILYIIKDKRNPLLQSQ